MRHWGIPLALAGLFLVVLAGRLWWGRAAVTRIPDRQEAIVQDALAWIEQDFEQRRAALEARARALAEDPELLHRIRDLSEDRPGAEEVVFRYVAGQSVDTGQGIELYDPTPRLLAWNGISMPLDEAPGSLQFLESVQTSVAVDAGHRAALVVWAPILEGTSVYGGVRVMELVWFDAPIRNQYLRDYSLADEWSRRLKVPVHVIWQGQEEALPPRDRASRLLQSREGVPIARVWVTPPEASRLLESSNKRFDDVLALLVFLMLVWGAVRLWQWVRAAPGAGRLSSRTARFSFFSLYWFSTRAVLLVIDVPARWQTGKAPLSPLFDPTHLASTFGLGLARSIGDLFVTSLFVALYGLALFVTLTRRPLQGLHRFRLKDRLHHRRAVQGSLARLFFVALAYVLAAEAVVALVATFAHRAVLDSTLDYFTISGLLPQRLVLLVFGALLILTFGGVLVIMGLAYVSSRVLERAGPVAGTWRTWLALGCLAGVIGMGAGYVLTPVADLIAWPAMFAFVVLGPVGLRLARVRRRHGYGVLTLRSILPIVLLLAMLVYPMVYKGLDAQLREWMIDAGESFDEGQDPRVHFALEQALQKAQSPEFRSAFETVLGQTERRTALDSVMAALLRGTLLEALRTHRVTLTVFDAHGHPLGRTLDPDAPVNRPVRDAQDEREFAILRQMYHERGLEGIFTDMMTSPKQHDRTQYTGLVPLLGGQPADTLGWLWARAIPEASFREEGFAFPRVLLPAGLYGTPQAALSLAEFRDGLLVRSQGRNFGRYRLDAGVASALRAQGLLWKVETIRDQAFMTLYLRHEGGPGADPDLDLVQTIIAVRTVAITPYDHLYYLLRLSLAGLFIGVPVYLLGLLFRWRRGMFPARRVRFRDKVLNAFFGVGLVTAAAMGLAGYQVVSGENARAIQSWLRQHLERVEDALERTARAGERPYRVLDRIPVDSLALSVGLDLNVYRDGRLEKTSRPQLFRDRLLDERLPAAAYQALLFDGFRYTFVEQGVGSFRYMAGYRALTDEQGDPRYVIGIPTLPEQERIEEEQARTMAYLFGALLLLVMVVMLTAGLLANALTRPIKRLREGLQAVAQGRFEKIAPLETRDEFGELVETFNSMQEQLAESRHRLAQQERQLAWREMARQVAHEIKNPLTPMKLSVQHLQRAFGRIVPPEAEAGAWAQFRDQFVRITGTLIEQIDALARIANEFSSYARMPGRIEEPLDLNAVVQEAVSLMQEEAPSPITIAPAPVPLVTVADREELRRIFINLLKNALQAIPPGREGRVEVTTEREETPEGPVAVCTVTDTGTGIPPALQEKIFEPNFSTKTRGTGLGLAIVRSSVEALGGRIGFETEEGVGTTFWIRLPLRDPRGDGVFSLPR